MSHNYAVRGFTLVELLVVVAIASILTVGTASMVRDVLAASQVKRGVDALRQSFALARSEAIKRNADVLVCKSKFDICDQDATWSHGWIVFHDANGNGQRDLAEAVLRRESFLHSSITFLPNEPVKTYVLYTSFGQTRSRTGALQAGTFSVCSSSVDGGYSQQLVINSTGKVRVSRGARLCR